MKRIINEGTINNNLIMEAMMDIENKGVIDNNNMVAGNNFENFGGNATGKDGAYYVNSNISNSPSAKFGSDVKVYVANSANRTDAAQGNSMNLLAAVRNDVVELNVLNPAKEKLSMVAIEKSRDGKHFSILHTISNVNKENGLAFNYCDADLHTNVIYYRAKAINAMGEEIVLPVASVKIPFDQVYSMAK